jgi:Sulfotransferase domain
MTANTLHSMNLTTNEFRKFSVPVCQRYKQFSKVFGIGANKTGSTSLWQVFNLIGLNAALQHEGELTSLALSKGNIAPLKSYIDRYDAFQDVPFSAKSTYAQIDALFPGSKFILTYRNSEVWFNSFLNHHKKVLGCGPATERPRLSDFEGKDYLYQGFRKFKFEWEWIVDVDANLTQQQDWALAFEKQHLVKLYEQRNEMIVRHFSNRPEDLLVIDITKEKDTEKILAFLKLPQALLTEMPHLNKN